MVLSNAEECFKYALFFLVSDHHYLPGVAFMQKVSLSRVGTGNLQAYMCAAVACRCWARLPPIGVYAQNHYSSLLSFLQKVATTLQVCG